MQKKKILFLMPSLRGGGAENALIKFLKEIDYDKYEVTLLLVSYYGPYINEVPSKVKLKYLFKNHFFVRLLGFLQKKFNWSFILNHYFKKVAGDNYDSAISFIDSNFTNLLFLLKKETKKITWVHSSYRTNDNYSKYLNNKSYLNKIIENRYKKLDEIVFVSKECKNEFVDVLGEFNNMKVLYNLFDEDYLKLQAKVKLPLSHQVTFVAVGSLIPVKGYTLLIDAARILKDKGYDFRVEILGEGNQESALKARVQKHDLKEEIQFLGYLPNPYAYMNRADVFVMTSVSEALPSALIEAMIIGKPVLITDTTGCREVIEYGKYGLMSDRTAEAFAEKMKAFIDNPDLKVEYAELALKKAKDFSKQNILSRFFDIID